jgi:hypothetical protein
LFSSIMPVPPLPFSFFIFHAFFSYSVPILPPHLHHYHHLALLPLRALRHIISVGCFLLLQFPLNKLSDQLREQIAQAGFTEVLTFSLVCTVYWCLLVINHRLTINMFIVTTRPHNCQRAQMFVV